LRNPGLFSFSQASGIKQYFSGGIEKIHAMAAKG
jgi:hypothetical protein